MIELRCEQGTNVWKDARLGIPTASGFSKIITATGKPSAQADAYIDKLTAEWQLGRPVEQFKGNYWTERGKDLEPTARGMYEVLTGRGPRQTGFIYRDSDRLVGCSPDWVFDGDGGIVGLGEIKCPSPTVHIGYVRENIVPKDYRTQIQGQLWVCRSAEWLDFISYCPGLPELIVRTERDKEFQKRLDDLIPAFIQKMLAARETITKQMEVAE